MIVNKINVLYPQKIYNIPFKAIDAENDTLKNNALMPEFYYKPLNVANKTPLQNDLLSIENLHCPVCGTKTLDQNKLDEIIHTKCNNISDLAKLIEENIEYLSPNFRQISRNLNKLAQNEPELPIDETLKKLYKGVAFSEKFIIDNLKSKIDEHQKKLNYNEHDKLIIKNIFQNIDNFVENKLLYKNCKDNINELIDNLEDENKNNLYKKINPALKEIVSIRYAVFQKNYMEYSPDERLEIFLSKIFVGSRKEIYSLPEAKNQYSTEPVCLCKNCKEARSSLINPYLPYKKIAENYVMYFRDILSAPNINDAMKDNVVKIRKCIEIMSKNNVNMSKVTSSEFDDVKLELYNIESVSSSFAPSNLNGVTCAACGTQTLPYDEKMNLRQKVDNARDIYELQDIIHENSHYINDSYKEAFVLFDELLAGKPDMSENEMLYSLKGFYTDRIMRNFNELNYIANTNLYDSKTSNEDRQRYFNYIKSTRDFYEDTNNSFPMLNFFNITVRTIEDIDDLKQASKIDKLIADIKRDWVIQNVLYPPKEYSRATKSALRDSINYTFARVSASTVHILSKLHGGDDSKENLMVVCTDCRKTKKDKMLDTWFRQYEKIPSNMQIYVENIQKIINENNLEDYADYPQAFIKKVKELTNYKINLELPKNS